MMTTPIVDILSQHAFFRGLSNGDLEFICGCARNVSFKENEIIAKRADPANVFYLIQEGYVAVTLDITSQKSFTFITLGANDILGWSWLIPPYEWSFSAQAMQLTRAIEINGVCLRDKCEHDTRLGYELLKRLLRVAVSRIDAARLRLLDVYGEQSK